ncbi:MAG: hypothetical protein AAFY53_03280 [Pseudomonadota bacterium]
METDASVVSQRLGTQSGADGTAADQAAQDAQDFQDVLFQVGLLGAQVAFDELIQQLNEDSRTLG